jgi:hypothetical protein
MRAARRATFAAYVLAMDNGEAPHESFEAALSTWQRFHPDEGDLEAHENVVSVVFAVLDPTDECDRWLLSA